MFLSALVLAWGIVPPGFEHAHAGGGDFDHQHDTCPEVAHHQSHLHESDAQHHEHATEADVRVLADYVHHFHWQLLGMGFSMPVPQEPVESECGGTVPLVVVRMVNDVVLATQPGSSLDRVFSGPDCALSPDFVCELDPIPRSPDFSSSIPLCDSARLERSGVLLA